jgi:ferredoxin
MNKEVRDRLDSNSCIQCGRDIDWEDRDSNRSYYSYFCTSVCAVDYAEDAVATMDMT